MRYAVISDIHGNMDALEAVLADARKQGAEGYLFAGDYCLSLPYPEEVIDRIRKIENAVLIRGNEEQYIERMRGEQMCIRDRHPSAPDSVYGPFRRPALGFHGHRYTGRLPLPPRRTAGYRW